jgi:hypothetical protein
MESQGSLPCSQEPAIGNYSEPDESLPHTVSLRSIIIIIMIIIVISCHRFSFFPGTSPLEPVVNPTTQASSLSL